MATVATGSAGAAAADAKKMILINNYKEALENYATASAAYAEIEKKPVGSVSWFDSLKAITEQGSAESAADNARDALLNYLQRDPADDDEEEDDDCDSYYSDDSSGTFYSDYGGSWSAPAEATSMATLAKRANDLEKQRQEKHAEILKLLGVDAL
jgi:hypothetical protein